MNKEVNYDVLLNNYVLERIYDVTRGALERLELAVSLFLVGHGAVNQEKSFSYTDLADFCGCSKRNIIKAIDRLQTKINQPDTGLHLSINRTKGTKNTYCFTTYIKKCDEDKKNDKHPPHTAFTIIKSYAYNQLTKDLRDKVITPNAARLLCLVWRQVFGYHNENSGIQHKNREMTKDYIKGISGIKGRDIYRAQGELRDLGYFIHLEAIPFYTNGIRTTRTNYEPRTININSYRKAPASTGHPSEKTTGVHRTPPHQRPQDTPTGVQETPPTIYTKENDNKDCIYNKDGLTTASLSQEKSEIVENPVSLSEIEGNSVSEVGLSTSISDRANPVSEADTAKERDADARTAISRFEAQRVMAALGMYADIAKLPPIEGLPKKYMVDYLKIQIDAIIKNSENYIDKHTNPIMAPSISQFSAFS